MIRIILLAFALGLAACATAPTDTNFAQCFSDDLVPDLDIPDCTRAIESDQLSDRDQASAHFNRALAYEKKGQYLRAIEDYGQTIRLAPNDADAYINRAWDYDKRGDYDRAIADLNQAIRLSPREHFAYNNRGSAYDSKGQYARAIQDYDQALQLKPDYANAHYNRGLAHKSLGRYGRAIDDFGNAIRLDPDDSLAYYHRGVVHGLNGSHALAVADFETQWRLAPDEVATDKQMLADLGYFAGAIDSTVTGELRAALVAWLKAGAPKREQSPRQGTA